MNNEMTLNACRQKNNDVLNLMSVAVRMTMDKTTRYYSKVLERRLSTRQTLCLLNAQLAFLMTVFPVECSFVLRLLCGAWLVSALLKCREEL